jgi:hypothetical protein
MRDGIILQQAYEENNNGGGYYSDMLRLTMQRHAAYARSHQMDYQVYFGEPTERDVFTGAWHKIKMIQNALERGYKYIFWLDTDTAIVDFSQDLRDAFTDKFIGCVEHKHENLPKEYDIPTHLNVGVVFVKNHPGISGFMQEWWDSFPGDKRWAEQGSFNEMAKKYTDWVFKMDDKYNATVNVNMCEKPVIVGWHGIAPAEKRFSMMKTSFLDDHIKFRV